MSEYGTVLSTDSIKKELYDMNRDYRQRKSWENLYTGVDIAERQQLGELKQDFAQAMSDAYSSAYQNKQAIGASNMGQGYKAAAIDDVDNALLQAYDTYRKNYLQGKAEIEAGAAEAVENIDAALTTQSSNMKKMSDKPYQYMQYLWDKYREGEDSDNIFLTDPLWKRYTKEELDEEGNVIDTSLKSWEEIMDVGAYEEDENGVKQWTGLYDDKGNLTIAGSEFYDFVMNDNATKGRYSFGRWLADNDEELYDWAKSYNPYEYTDAKTNLGSFNTMVGLTSTDQTYSFIERFGGMTERQVNDLYKDFSDKATELGERLSNDSGRGAKDILQDYNSLSKDIENLATRLGIKEDLEKEMGVSFDALGAYLQNKVNKAKSNEDIWGDTLAGAVVGGAGVTAVTGSLIQAGILVASSIPVAGWIIGAILAAGAIGFAGASAAESSKEYNRRVAESGRKAFDNLVVNLVQYSRMKRKETQANWNNRF